jgi:hypothetical protein
MEMQLPGKETQSGWVVVKLLHQGQGNVGTKAQTWSTTKTVLRENATK